MARREISTRGLDLPGLYGFRTLTRWATLCLISARRNHLWGRRGPYPPLSYLTPQAPPLAQTHLLLRGRTLTATRTFAIPRPQPKPGGSAQPQHHQPPATSLAPAAAQLLPPHAPLVMAPPMRALASTGAVPAETQPILSSKGGRTPVLPRLSPPRPSPLSREGLAQTRAVGGRCPLSLHQS